MPYRFEVDAAAFVSTKGDVTARIEGELDQRITQRLILQPRAEVALSAQDIPELGIGAGLDRIEAGLSLRSEFARESAPYKIGRPPCRVKVCQAESISVVAAYL